MKQGDNKRNYHAQLYALFKLLTTAGRQLTNVPLRIGPNRMMQVDLITWILFVIQDMEEGDMLCGCYGSHRSGMQRHSRAYDVDPYNLDNPDVKCSVLINGSIKQRVGQCNTMPNPKLLFNGPSWRWCLCASRTYRCQRISRGSFQNNMSCSTSLRTWNALARRSIIVHNVLNHF